MLIKHSIVAPLAFSLTASTTATEFSIGASTVYNESPYRGYNDNVHAIPLISYEGESFYFRQTTLGYISSKSESNKFSITASYMSLEFDPGDNDDHTMKRLDKRNAAVVAGAAQYHHERWDSVKVSVVADMLDNSNGWAEGVSLFRSTPTGKLALASSIGVLYHDEKFNKYYYDISGNKPRRSGLSNYSLGDSWTPYVGLFAKYTSTTNLTLLASVNYNALPDDIKNNPMVDRDDSFTFMSGLIWRF